MWFSFRTRLTQWENQHYVETNFTKMAWLWDHRASTRHSLEVQIVAKRVRMDAFFDARSLGGVMTRMPNGFRIDRLITAVVVVAGKEPFAGFSPQAAPMCAEFFK